MKLKLLKYVNWTDIAVVAVGVGLSIKSYKDLLRKQKELLYAHCVSPYPYSEATSDAMVTRL